MVKCINKIYLLITLFVFSPFIKVDKECGAVLFDNSEFEDCITKL